MEILLGNERLLERIDRMINGERFFHACIISGEEGSGRRKLVRYLAAAAVCTAEKKPCGECLGCRKAEKQIHPDIYSIEPEGKNITVGQIRSIRTGLYSPPNEAPRRVVIIPDGMNTAAQNALLNIMEEPPSDILFVLIVENESTLLSTVRSRGALFRVSPVSESVAGQELRRRFPDAADADIADAVKLSGGILGQAIKLLSEEDAGSTAEKIVSAFARGDRKELLKLCAPLEKVRREELRGLLEEVRALLGTRAKVEKKKKYIQAAEEVALLIKYTDANVGSPLISGRITVKLLKFAKE